MLSSVARGGGGYSPPIGLKSMQNTTFSALLMPIFALKAKIILPLALAMRSGQGPEFRPEKLGFSLVEDLFFLSFWRSSKFEQKSRLNLTEDFFLFFLEITKVSQEKPSQPE